jgi:hypothetical protein
MFKGKCLFLYLLGAWPVAEVSYLGEISDRPFGELLPQTLLAINLPLRGV